MRWCSSDTNIVTVNNKGLVYAKSVGNAVITGRTATGYTVAVKVKVIEGGTAQALLKVMSSWLNYSESNRKHRKIIDIYNSYGNLPVGYKVKYSDAWCDTCVSAAAIISGNVAQIGRECGVTRHVELFKKKKIWIENGSIIPKPGYLIVYNWGKSRQPNNSGGSHIGVVYSVKKRWITTLEGNYGDKVKMRRIPVGWGFIRGYAKPKYRK
ncbi:MAG: CHAP domain-containing protein [Eubacterium sp.]|nr:CHAP domain-containing protein [Eubacterium sp.]